LSYRDTIRLPFRSPLLRALRRRARDQRGSALVEVAVTTIPLLMLIFGVIEISLAIYNFHYLANAAHEAARYAIVRGSSWSTGCDGSGSAGSGYGSSQCTASTNDIANYVANRNFPGISIAASNVCVQYFSSVPSSTSNSCTTSTGTLANAPGDIVEVRIRVPYQVTIPGLPVYTWNLQSTSQMVIAQ
jgi:Flp pilus assembly protein TadG